MSIITIILCSIASIEYFIRIGEQSGTCRVVGKHIVPLVGSVYRVQLIEPSYPLYENHTVSRVYPFENPIFSIDEIIDCYYKIGYRYIELTYYYSYFNMHMTIYGSVSLMMTILPMIVNYSYHRRWCV
jgi:hypothetical protein